MEPFTAQSPLTQLDPKQNGGILPRNINVKAFEPHRTSFSCVHEATKVPPIDPEAERLFQEGMAASSEDLSPDKRDHRRAVELWTQAARLNHWKALLNLAGVYATGKGEGQYAVAANPGQAIAIVEHGMQLGIPSAFDMLGNMYHEGILRDDSKDSSRAYALWELAADMGSASAQAFLGEAMDANRDGADHWNNRKIGLQMLECSYAQGNGKGSYELGFTVDVVDKQHQRAMQIFHDGVKYGSQDCADALTVRLDSSNALNGFAKDPARAERYSILSDALWQNPDLRFPNLDKVLPLPPAKLPTWNGNKQHLIDAAKAIVPTPGPAAPHPNTALQGPEHVPAGHTLSGTALYSLGHWQERADRAGYWKPRVALDGASENGWRTGQQVNAKPARLYDQGELLESFAALHANGPGHALWAQLDKAQLESAQWDYLGEATPVASAPVHPLVRRGVAVQVEMLTEVNGACVSGASLCPTSGIWAYLIEPKHPQSAACQTLWFNQAYVEKGQAFPVTPEQRMLGLTPGQQSWRYLGFANSVTSAGVFITVPETGSA